MYSTNMTHFSNIQAGYQVGIVPAIGSMEEGGREYTKQIVSGERYGGQPFTSIRCIKDVV